MPALMVSFFVHIYFIPLTGLCSITKKICNQDNLLVEGIHPSITKPLLVDRYGRLLSIVKHLSPTWSYEEVILCYPNIDGKIFKFPLV